MCVTNYYRDDGAAVVAWVPLTWSTPSGNGHVIFAVADDHRLSLLSDDSMIPAAMITAPDVASERMGAAQLVRRGRHPAFKCALKVVQVDSGVVH